MNRVRAKPVSGHRSTFRTSGGVQQGMFLVGARTIVECRCGWTSERALSDWARMDYRKHLDDVRNPTPKGSTDVQASPPSRS